MTTPSPPALLTVYFVWHPLSPAGRELAIQMFHELCANPDSPAERGLGIPVRFRTAGDDGGVPGPIPFGASAHTAVFILADAQFSGDWEWRAYADQVADAAQEGDLVVPVALTAPDRIPRGLQDLQAIRLDQTDDALRPITLRQRVVHDLCRLLEPEAGKVRVFISYARADGDELARRVRRHLREEALLDDFFDEADIPDGSRFAEFVHSSVEAAPILVALHTDAYSSREWCRLEVLDAKRLSVPIVVLTAIERGEARSFPYMGNVPAVRWTGGDCLPELVNALLREVLRARYFPLRAKRICALQGLPAYETFVHPPELLTALLYRETVADADGHEPRYLYPDPPLGTEELALLRLLDPDNIPLTPTVLSSL